jgi:hypothetical protein
VGRRRSAAAGRRRSALLLLLLRVARRAVLEHARPLEQLGGGGFDRI